MNPRFQGEIIGKNIDGYGKNASSLCMCIHLLNKNIPTKVSHRYKNKSGLGETKKVTGFIKQIHLSLT